MLVTSSKPERKKGRKKTQIYVYEEPKKKEVCEHKMLKSGFAFLRKFLAPLGVDTQSSVSMLLKKRWIAIVEQPD
jgi:hypothetical protein